MLNKENLPLKPYRCIFIGMSYQLVHVYHIKYTCMYSKEKLIANGHVDVSFCYFALFKYSRIWHFHEGGIGESCKNI